MPVSEAVKDWIVATYLASPKAGFDVIAKTTGTAASVVSKILKERGHYANRTYRKPPPPTWKHQLSGEASAVVMGERENRVTLPFVSLQSVPLERLPVLTGRSYKRLDFAE